MTRDDEPLTDVYRTVRALRVPEDGPWPGFLARTVGGEACVLVDSLVLGADWTGWDAARDGHVLAPRDVARRTAGHDVVLPVCTEPLEQFLHRRAARYPLTIGEAVTLGVSVLRGCAELAARPDATGMWWLDHDGRPLVATDTCDRRVRDAAADALRSVVVDPPLERAWQAAVDALRADRLAVRDLVDAEDALFRIAAPEPLTTTILNPRGAADASPARAESQTSVESSTLAEAPPRSLWQNLVSQVDADLGDAVSRATTAVWRRARRPGRSRRAPWLVGGTVAAAVLTGGALWPADAGTAPVAPDAPATADAGTPDATPNPGAAGAPPESDSAAGAQQPPSGAGSSRSSEDLAAIASGLLDAMAACGDDPECRAGAIADPAVSFGGGAIALPPADRTVTLIDDFGDIAVVRVDANDGGHPPQLVVISRQDGEWLLRDVHDVAQQP